MISIIRTDEPSSLAENKVLWLNELLEAIDIHNQASTKKIKDSTKKEVTKKQSRYRNKQIKDANGQVCLL